MTQKIESTLAVLEHFKDSAELRKTFEDRGYVAPTAGAVRMWRSRQLVPPSWKVPLLRVAFDLGLVTTDQVIEILEKETAPCG